MMDIPHALSAAFKNSFAYKTVKDRLPTILTKAVDTTHRHKHEIGAAHGQEGSDDLKSVIHCLSELRYRLQTDKPLTPITSNRPDVAYWNAHLKSLEEKEPEPPSWFKSAWLDVECYFYRKILEAFDNSRFLHEWDPFRFQKEQSFVGALPAMTTLADHLQKVLKAAATMDEADKRSTVDNLLQVSLWGNKFDLSISGGEQHEHSEKSPEQQVEDYKPNIVVNDTGAAMGRLFEASKTGSKPRRLDIILDNAGMELFGDLCLAEFLLTAGLCDHMTLHCKAVPWFVSDTTCRDLSWVLEMLRSNSAANMRDLGHKWHSRLDDGTITVRADGFWTTASPFRLMPEQDPQLFSYFDSPQNGGVLAIYKGDLNYRKLVGDLAWPTTTPFRVAIREFQPKIPFVVLRSLKSDVCVGMKEGQDEELTKKNKDWMLAGDYAVIQYFCKEK